MVAAMSPTRQPSTVYGASARSGTSVTRSMVPLASNTHAYGPVSTCRSPSTSR
jgi:hypothetical protein